MREAIETQRVAFKQDKEKAGWLRCGICSTDLAWSDAEIDHLPPVFQTLADTYAEAAGGYDKIQLVPSADGMIGQPLAPGDEQVWILYHQRTARLRVLCRPCHHGVTRQQKRGAP